MLHNPQLFHLMDSIHNWIGRKEIATILADEFKVTVEQMEQWMDEALAPCEFQEHTYGVEVSFMWSKEGKYFLFNLYPSEGPNQFTYDGRNVSYSYRLPDVSRFSQKRFDIEWRHWMPYSQLLAALYMLRGHEHPDKMREFINTQVYPGLKDHTIDVRELHRAEIADALGILGELSNETQTQNNNQSNEMEQTILHPALTICAEEGSAAEQRIAERVQNAITNGGRCVYNVIRADEQYDTPKIIPVSECFNAIADDENFAGWKNYEKVTMLDISHKNFPLTDGKNITDFMPFTKETQVMAFTNKFYAGHGDNCTSVAIRVESHDGTVFEYIIEKTLAA